MTFEPRLPCDPTQVGRFRSAIGDALHAVLCAAGYNLRSLLRAIARLGITAAFLRLSRWWRQGANSVSAELMRALTGGREILGDQFAEWWQRSAATPVGAG